MQTERILGDVLGGDVSHDAIRAMSADDFLELDRRLDQLYRCWSPSPPPVDSFRAFVPMGLPGETWAFEAALLFANSVTVPDPIDCVFFGGVEGVALVAGIGLSLEQGGEYSDAALDAARVDLLTRLATSDEGLSALRSRLLEAVVFLEVWHDALEVGILHLTPLRTTVGVGMKVAHLATKREGLLPEAFGQFLEDESSDPGLSVYHEIRDAWPLANLRFAHAQQSRSRLVATDPYEWHYLQESLKTAAGPVERDRDLVDGKVVVGLAAAISELTVPISMDPFKALEIRRASDEFQEWQAGLRVTIRRMPAEATPGTRDFEGAAANVLEEELGPRIQAIEGSKPFQRLIAAAPRELVTLSLGAAGIAGLGEVTSVSPASFAAPPILTVARLAAGAAFGAAGADSTVLARLIK